MKQTSFLSANQPHELISSINCHSVHYSEKDVNHES